MASRCSLVFIQESFPKCLLTITEYQAQTCESANQFEALRYLSRLPNLPNTGFEQIILQIHHY